jgi:hypothetical protein
MADTTRAGAAQQINDGGPAFARPATLHETQIYSHAQAGMTLRDYFAVAALPMVMEQRGESSTTAGRLDDARRAYAMADAMLIARLGA